MKIKNKKVPGMIAIFMLTICFLVAQDVQESLPEVNRVPSQLQETVDSLQNELSAYQERESILLKHVNHQEYTITAYLPVDPKEGRYSGVTATGTIAKPNTTVAVDPKVVPFNAWVWIDGLGWWKAEDTGNMVKGKRIDLCVSTREEANEFGIRKMRIKILK
ncbi:MAG: 3D domain-containing protein [Candidatus Zixiibacteriota bacterium]